VLDVHLMLTNTDAWIDRYAEAGSNLLTVHRQFCNDVSASLNQIRSRGAQAGLVVELGDALSIEELHLDTVDRLLVMGTEIGVKGKGLHPNTARRIGTILDLCGQVGRCPEIVIDGGIRRETVPLLIAKHLVGSSKRVMVLTSGPATAEAIAPGKVTYVPPIWAHRSVNTGDVPLVFLGRVRLRLTNL
jgi:ribulose-phosphate 3-epimerase